MTHQQLNHYMLALKLTQAALARLTYTSPRQVVRWCNGHAPVPKLVDALIRLWVMVPGAFDTYKVHHALTVKG